MRTLIINILTIALALGNLHAQDLNIHKTDGSIISIPLNTIDSITYFESGSAFECGVSTVTDIDGNVYNTVQIGDQCWLQQNLNTGIRIDITVPSANNGIIEKYCYQDLESNCEIYGGLYRWNEMMQYTATPGAQGICPQGWHVPDFGELSFLEDYVSSQPAWICEGDPYNTAKALASTSGWNTYPLNCAVGDNQASNNASGFTGMPGGILVINGTYIERANRGFWWTSSEYTSSKAHYIYLSTMNAYVTWGFENQEYGFSVRCIKDAFK